MRKTAVVAVIEKYAAGDALSFAQYHDDTVVECLDGPKEVLKAKVLPKLADGFGSSDISLQSKSCGDQFSVAQSGRVGSRTA